MGYRLFLSFSCLVLLSLFSLWTGAETTSAPLPSKVLPADIRMIIDVSGSMKKTDPHNLRRPAVDLMVRLLPDGSKAGIWTFGQSVNLLVPYRLVDESWRQQAAKSASAINSVALHTHIGAALEKAAQDAVAGDDGFRRNLVLLTDGVVDIDPEAVVNIQERKRILTELLPQLKAAGYVIHTIALSQDADQELMKKLALTTDGVFAVAQSADELMQAFLTIFDQAVPAERVPLDDKGFLVDASIQEFTALIFRKAEVPATIIIAPDGKEFTETDPAHNVNWYKTGKYDLITVQQPQAGQWRIKTEMAPNSRVTVVSNLQLQVAPLKTQVQLGQPVELQYSFAENQQTITTPEFLQLLAARIIVARADDPLARTQDLVMEPAPANGIFQAGIANLNQAGDYQIRLSIDGKTFKREFVHQLQVNESAFHISKEVRQENGTAVFQYWITANPELVDKHNTRALALISIAGQDQPPQNIRVNEDGVWRFSLVAEQAAEYHVYVDMKGIGLDGAPLEERLLADEFYYPDEASVLNPIASSSSTGSSSLAIPAEELPPSNNLLLYIGVGIANLLVLIIGFFVYRMIAGNKNQAELQDMENTLNTPVATRDQLPPVAIDLTEPGREMDIPIDEAHTTIAPDDQLMADNLFPLDNLDDDSSKDKP